VRRWYQNVEIEGAVYEGAERKHSKFWNKGKWESFVKPLLPRERQVFIELGCNAGLFLKMASDAGFERVIGVEASDRVMRQAEVYRESIGGKWKLVQERIGGGFDPYSLPIADVVLMSNFHYYIGISDFDRLVNDLRNRTLYCIVVSARVRRAGGKAFFDISSVRGYFRDWVEVGLVEEVDMMDDPAPRRGMYGITFKGRLQSQEVGGFYRRWRRECEAAEKFRYHALPPALVEFFELVLLGEEFNYEETLLYQYWRKREPNRSREWIQAKLDQKKTLAESVRDDGMMEPLYFDHRNNLIDGLHRQCIAKVLGYEHIVARRM
jgi:hypothetical protein